jgi:CHAT domain-containing protein/lipoprotein NlpI
VGASTIEQNDQKQLKDYLLGRLDEAGVDTVENRLLSDENYSEELHIVTNELIDQYADDQIAAEDREAVERFIFESEAPYKKLRFALVLKRRASESQRKSRDKSKFLRFYLPIAASILLVVGLGVWWKFSNQSQVDRGLLALRTAYRDQRPVEARVSDFDYAPTSRGVSEVNSLQRDLAMGLLTQAAVDNPSAPSHHALGQYYITQHQFDKAIEQLKASLVQDPQNARAHSDLGVALFELGKQANANNDEGVALKHFVESHTHLKKAVELDPSLQEAQFNLGLVLERMGLPQAAEENWRKYLEKDSTSPWANEARQRLQALQERQKESRRDTRPLEDFLEAYRNRDEQSAWQILSRNREVVTGKFVLLSLVNAYLESASTGRREEATDFLAALDYAGELEARKAGDLYTSGVASFYRSLPSRHLAAAREAYRLTREGYELCATSGFSAAVKVFEQARDIFEAIENEIEAAFVGYWVAFSYRHSHRIDEGRQTANDLLPFCKERNYKWLLAQILGLLSNIYTSSGEESAVLRLDREALSLSEEVNDEYGTQKYLASLAGKYSVIYNFSESLDYLARCLIRSQEFWPGDRQTWRNYDTATQLFNRMGLYTASAAYGEQAHRLAVSKVLDPSFIYLSYVHLGMAYSRLDNFAEGIKHAQSGFEIGQSLPDKTVGREIMAYSALQLGELHRQSKNLKEAADRYNQAIAIYDQTGFHTFKFVAHRGRLLTYLAQGDDAAAQRELQVVLNLFEEYRSKIKEEDNRNYFFDVTQEIYDAGIEFSYSRLKDDEAAFRYSEESHARSLFATMLSNTQADSTTLLKPYSHLEIKQQLPEQIQILQYAVLPDRVLIWLVSRSQFLLTETTISSDALNKDVRTYLDLVRRPSSDLNELHRASIALHKILIGPIEGELISGKTLCVVPDKILNYLPFATLVSSKSNQYLIADHAIIFSPSSSVFLVNTEVAQHKRVAGGEKLLSIGNPSFDRRLFSSLSDLPSAAVEARSVARFYDRPSPVVMIGADAERDHVIKAMGNVDILHFASHYVVDERSPLRSQFLLTGAESLFAGDIYEMKLSRPRLAVLSACTTGVERYYNGEGMIGMARTFLVAGVPVVVAGQWQVDTVSTTGLMTRFHEYRRAQRLPTVEALRLAQTEIINDKSNQYSHPYYWAPFVTIGGYSTY